MKKFKKVATSLLCLAMSGSMFFAVGCDDDNPPASSNPGGTTPTEVVATQADKTLFFNSLTGVVGSFETNPEQIVKLTLDLDMKSISGDIVTDAEGNIVSETKQMLENNFDAAAYFQMKGESISLDAWLNGEMQNDEGKFYGYADMYIRGDDLYFGATDELPAKPTDADKAAIEYTKESLSAIWQELMENLGVGMGQPAPESGGNIESGSGSVGTMSVTSADADEAMGMEDMQDLLVKAITNVLNGITATVKTEGNVKTLTLDFKKEAESILNVMKILANSISEGKTMNDLLNNAALEVKFNQYLGTLTAQEIRDVLAFFVLSAEADPDSEEVQEVLPLPEEGISGYKYLISVIASMPADETTGETVGSQKFDATDKEKMLASLKEVEDILAQINSLKFGIRTTDNAFSGIVVDIDIKDTVDMYLSVSMETMVSYNFKDLSGLQIAPLFPSKDDLNAVA